MTSDSSKNEAKSVQNRHVDLTRIAEFGMGYAENHLSH